MTREQSIQVYGEDLTEVFGVMRDGDAIVARIKMIVAAGFGFAATYMMDNNRRQFVADARHVWRWLSHKHTNLTLDMIGQLTCKADHTTVMHSIRRVNELMETDAPFRRGVQKLDEYVARDVTYTHHGRSKQTLAQIRAVVHTETGAGRTIPVQA